MTDTEDGVRVQLREEAGSIGESVQQQATEVKEKGARELRSQLDERTTQAGGQARSLASALRSSGSELELHDGNAAVARLTAGVADRLERLGGYLERVRGEELLRDAEQLARRRPWLLTGAAAAAGFAASRFLKASSERRYDGQRASDPYGQARDPARSGDSFPSAQYPTSPPVAVGPAGTPPAH